MKWAIWCLAVGALGCGDGSDESHAHGSHAHAELPGQSITLWTDKAELFMEWSPLIAGRESRFLAHLTDLRDGSAFKPAAEGEVIVTIAVLGSKPQSAGVPAPERLGIFTPSITPNSPGLCTLTITITTPFWDETFETSHCVVHPDKASAQAAAAEHDEASGQIAFLKEQQWTIDFTSAAAQKQNIVPSKTINAKILSVPGREVRLTAGTAGRLSMVSPVPTLGSEIREGQLLARIQPTMSAPGSVGSLKADVTAARAEFGAAEAAHSRLARLVASDSIPKRRLEEAAVTVSVAGARLSAAKTRLSSYLSLASGKANTRSGAFQVKAPISGTLVAQSVTQGETVSGGDSLFTVIDLERVWVEGRIFEPDVPAFESTKTAWFTVDGRDTVFEIAEPTGKLITVGHVLDPSSRTVPVIFEVENPGRVLRIGQFAKLSVATGVGRPALVIPEAALLQDGNKFIVYVHVSGEAFERRVLSLGSRSRGLVEVLQGVTEGEHVVTKGAYDLKLAASAGGAPAHGHAH